MNVVPAIVAALQLVLRMIDEIQKGLEEGVSDEEIRWRIARPGGVAQDLLDSVRQREKKFESPFEDDGVGV